jgi:hypothetical protein
MRARTLGAAAAAGLTVAALIASPAQAANGQSNNRNSHSVIYTRPCLNYGSSSCALAVVGIGKNFPSNARYAMPGTGWTMCHIAGKTRCISGSSYVDISGWRDYGFAWIVNG